ncbi:MAG: RNA-binding protein [Candidatus Micrarchaeota archaeon]|nr:RNA-binding protein [Candidatus Micrarchaeota archaeon]
MALKITKFLSNKDLRELSTQIDFDFKSFKVVNIGEIDGKIQVVLCDSRALFFLHNGKWTKTLALADSLPSAFVDKGAIKFVVSGADVMRPGILKFESFSKDDIIAVREAEHNTPLCIGIALLSSDEMQKMEKGKAIKNIHHTGDEIWKLTRA